MKSSLRTVLLSTILLCSCPAFAAAEPNSVEKTVEVEQVSQLDAVQFIDIGMFEPVEEAQYELVSNPYMLALSRTANQPLMLNEIGSSLLVSISNPENQMKDSYRSSEVGWLAAF